MVSPAMPPDLGVLLVVPVHRVFLVALPVPGSEKDTGRSIVCDVAGFPYTLIWSALSKPLRFVCIEPWNSLPASVDDPQEWSQRAAAACLAPGGEWSTTLSTTFER